MAMKKFDGLSEEDWKHAVEHMRDSYSTKMIKESIPSHGDSYLKHCWDMTSTRPSDKPMAESQSISYDKFANSGYSNTKDDDFTIDDKTFSTKIVGDWVDGNKINTKWLHNHMEFGKSKHNYALRKNTTTYNFHVIPSIDVVSVTKLSSKVSDQPEKVVHPYVEESHTMTIEDARKFYIELTENGYVEA